MDRHLRGIRFLTVPEVMKVLRVSNMTVYGLIERGELAAVRVGRAYRIYENSLLAYLNQEPEEREEPPA